MREVCDCCCAAADSLRRFGMLVHFRDLGFAGAGA